MNLDLRIPMGLMFTLVGLILTVYGFATSGSSIYARSLNMNVNLEWGVVLLAFGLVMFSLGRRGQRRALLAPKVPVPEGTVRRGH